ncbi:AAA family ATPase [Lactococcus cremoris]|uniref:ATPase AAA-type core domain-containing protein n=1 Tax=Lactococcus cremoris subsp. cremoris GE214 TaxID=1415168 RepID=A0A084ABH6_LACLC|nr:ATP-binding protein [Lactococcus cremoris]KEY62655.1 hypothetical protein U725_01163 [Lactococcus cremoris subsp. cremoris GE214]
MLQTFSVKGFKNFSEEITFKLKGGNFEFNNNGIRDDIVKTAVIYGDNASGKSNLGLAIMDIVTHLTDNNSNTKEYVNHYLNLNDKNIKKADFKYIFKFDDDIVEYRYSKTDYDKLSEEVLLVNKKEVIVNQPKKDNRIINLTGTDTLNIRREDLSLVKLVYANANISDKSGKNEEKNDTKVFFKFMEFVNNMLSFDSIYGNHYRGFTTGRGNIPEKIVEKGKIKGYQKFLSYLGIEYNLFPKDVDGKKEIYAKFPSGKIANFFSIMSKGTMSLSLFYMWYMQFEEGVQFVFIDEFDSYFHHKVSRKLVKLLLDTSNIQVVLTTHNTANMSNELLRPDCYFVLENGTIDNIANRSGREIRKAQSIEKMYRAGAFDNE